MVACSLPLLHRVECLTQVMSAHWACMGVNLQHCVPLYTDVEQHDSFQQVSLESLYSNAQCTMHNVVLTFKSYIHCLKISHK